jgi:hypothetical protein
MQHSAGQLLKRISFGRIHATVWKHSFRRGQKDAIAHDISICRKYQDGDGNWRESHSFSPQDLPCLRMVISGALRFLKTERHADTEGMQAAPDPRRD